jgi:hypothetical protein
VRGWPNNSLPLIERWLSLSPPARSWPTSEPGRQTLAMMPARPRRSSRP